MRYIGREGFRGIDPVATYADYQKLLADPNVNAVVIATPNLLHREMLRAALQAQGTANLARFSWERSADVLWQAVTLALD